MFLSAGKGPDENPDGTIKMLKPGDPGVILSRGPVEQQAANINDAWVDAKGTFRAGVSYGIWTGLHHALGGSFGAALAALLLALAGGLGAYLVACRLLGVRELETLLSLRRRRIA